MPFLADEMTRAKLCVLYLLKTVKVSLSLDCIIIGLEPLDWINQFMLMEALSDLKETRLIFESDLQGRKTYLISEKGEESLGHFINEIPLSMRQSLDEKRDSLRLRAKMESEYRTDYRKLEDGRFLTELTIMEEGRPIFHVEVELATSAQAHAVCKAWHETASKAYAAILSPITTPQK